MSLPRHHTWGAQDNMVDLLGDSRIAAGARDVQELSAPVLVIRGGVVVDPAEADYADWIANQKGKQLSYKDDMVNQQIITSPGLGFQNGAKNRDLRCVLHLSLPRRCCVRNMSRIQNKTIANPIPFMVDCSAPGRQGMGAADGPALDERHDPPQQDQFVAMGTPWGV